MNRMVHNQTRHGFSVIEILIGLTIFSVIFLFIYETLTLYFANQSRLLDSTQALYLAEAAQEYTRFVRDTGWTNLSDLTPGTTYHFAVSTTTIATTTSPELVHGRFTRSFVVWPAYRDGDDDLVASTTPGASADTDSFMVHTFVTWGTDAQVQLDSFVGNLHN